MYSTEWKIKARVTKLGQERTWNNAKGTGRLLTFDMMDKEGTQMQATMFNEDIDKFVPSLEEGKVYEISQAYIKMANKRFTSITNDFCMTFQNKTELREVQNN